MSPGSASHRLGKNLGCYRGETVEIQPVLQQIQLSAIQHGWKHDCFLNADAFCLVAYHRSSGAPRKRVYISAGIHGDEPAGPLAVLQLVQENRWPAGVDVWLCPCLNPS